MAKTELLYLKNVGAWVLYLKNVGAKVGMDFT